MTLPAYAPGYYYTGPFIPTPPNPREALIHELSHAEFELDRIRLWALQGKFEKILHSESILQRSLDIKSRSLEILRTVQTTFAEIAELKASLPSFSDVKLDQASLSLSAKESYIAEIRRRCFATDVELNDQNVGPIIQDTIASKTEAGKSYKLLIEEKVRLRQRIDLEFERLGGSIPDPKGDIFLSLKTHSIKLEEQLEQLDSAGCPPSSSLKS